MLRFQFPTNKKPKIHAKTLFQNSFADKISKESCWKKSHPLVPNLKPETPPISHFSQPKIKIYFPKGNKSASFRKSNTHPPKIPTKPSKIGTKSEKKTKKLGNKSPYLGDWTQLAIESDKDRFKSMNSSSKFREIHGFFWPTPSRGNKEKERGDKKIYI